MNLFFFFFSRFVVDVDSCRWKGSPVVVRVTADLEKRMTEHTLWRMLDVSHNVFYG